MGKQRHIGICTKTTVALKGIAVFVQSMADLIIFPSVLIEIFYLLEEPQKWTPHS